MDLARLHRDPCGRGRGLRTRRGATPAHIRRWAGDLDSLCDSVLAHMPATWTVFTGMECGGEIKGIRCASTPYILGRRFGFVGGAFWLSGKVA
jgi:hypothetical protein